MKGLLGQNSSFVEGGTNLENAALKVWIVEHGSVLVQDINPGLA